MKTVERRVVGLALTFTTAKLLLLALRSAAGSVHLSVSFFAPFVMLHQDALFVLAWAGVDLTLLRLSRGRSERVAVAFYWLVAAYCAINVPIALRLSTPLTSSMLGAVGRALSDSIVKYVTPRNVISMLLVLGAAAAPSGLRAPSRRAALRVAGGLFAIAIVGSVAARQTETLGLHRNPLVALASTTYRTWTVARDLDTTIRAGTLPAEGPSLDLSSLRGRAAGKNVVWVLLESTGARYTGLYGGIPDPTPRLTAFAEKSVVFDSVHCAIPDSIRGLFSMLCSVVPRPYVSLAAYAAERAPCESIAGTLAAAGYRTGFFHSGRFRYIGMKAIVEGRGFHVLRDAESIAAQHESSFGIDDASTARSVLAFVDSVAEGPKAPFFAVYSPIAGHHPYRSPGPGHGQLPGNDERELYLNDLTTGDVAFGILVDGIRSRGLLENTLFVIVGDHGQAFDQHPGNFGHTLFVYEENTHVPFVVVAPGLLTEKLRAPQIGSLVDMAPTTLALLGIDASASHHGRSLLRPAPGSALFMTDHDLLKAGLRHSHYKLLYESEHERFRLFDLQSDPGEQTDIARSQPARVALYERHLLEWLGLR